MANSLREELMASHDEFRRLAEEHSRYCQRLETLTQKRYLSDEEQLEEVRLKKLKLRVKDDMESMEMRFRQQHQVA
jgi:hypothetical protein